MRCLLTAICLLACTNVLGQDVAKPPQPTRAQAEKLVQDGDRLADQGDYATALEKYTEAYHEIVSRIRGQKFSHQVLPTLLTRPQLGEEMLKEMDREYTPEEWALMDSSYQVFGMMPSDVSSKELMAKLLTEEVAGFYDPSNKRMVLVREEGGAKDPGFFERLLGAKPAFDKAEQKTTLAHEMTHALQDQLYDLRKMQKLVEKDDDMSLAFSALVEGDATLLMFTEMDGGTGNVKDMDPEMVRSTFSIMSFMMPVAGGTTYRKAPAIFRDSLIFPYFQGMVFTTTLAQKDGWPSVHAAYATPPTSTEQILHPEKYLPEQRDDPQRVILPDFSQVIPSAWRHMGGNCLGEFQTSIMLKKSRSGRRAAEGWDGDRYEVYRQSDGRLGLVYVSVWDSAKDAEEFVKAYRDARRPTTESKNDASDDQDSTDVPADAKAAKPVDSTKPTEPTNSVPAPDQAGAVVLGAVSTVKIEGDKVWIIEGFHADVAGAIEQLLPQATFESKPFGN